ncbi:MAG: hypothetical protein WC307_00455 [Candidatus Nanoarchaeia archaeon]|jgi:hypothetical protein
MGLLKQLSLKRKFKKFDSLDLYDLVHKGINLKEFDGLKIGRRTNRLDILEWVYRDAAPELINQDELTGMLNYFELKSQKSYDDSHLYSDLKHELTIWNGSAISLAETIHSLHNKMVPVVEDYIMNRTVKRFREFYQQGIREYDNNKSFDFPDPDWCFDGPCTC